MEFSAWPKTPRLNRDMVITEKIDGTNAAVVIEPALDAHGSGLVIAYADSATLGACYAVGAQSRNRMIKPDQDNAGFARWVGENAEALVNALGPGRHFGEWWGQGIQRGYGLKEKRFSLFNVNRYKDADFSALPQVGLVPVLFTGPFRSLAVNATADWLERNGSQAAPGFMRPEGIIVFHTALNGVFKVTLEGDEAPKTLAKAA